MNSRAASQTPCWEHTRGCVTPFKVVSETPQPSKLLLVTSTFFKFACSWPLCLVSGLHLGVERRL